MISQQKSILQLFVLLCTINLLTACREDTKQKENVKVVKSTFVEQFNHSSQLVYPAVVKAQQEINLAFKLDGKLRVAYVKQGDRVKKGQLLAELEKDEYQWQFDATDAEYQQVMKETDRIIELYNRKSVSQSDYDKAMAGRKRITSLYNVHKKALEDTRLYAPCDGTIGKINYTAGEVIAKGFSFTRLNGGNDTEIELFLSTIDYLNFANFMDYSAELTVNPTHRIILHPVSLSHDANENQLFTLRLRMNKPEKEILPGMSMTVYISLKNPEDSTYQIPLPAVYSKNGVTAVWVLKDNVVHTTPIEVIQVMKNGKVLVKGNIQTHDEIVTAGVDKLKEGETVKKLPQYSKSNVGGLL